MRQIEVYNSTALVEALLSYKGVKYKVHSEPCPAFQDAKHPVIEDSGRWIIGIHPILGYLDRRYLWPEFFPGDHDGYAKASMVFDMFLNEDPDPNDWLPIIQNGAFVLGKDPCVIDLILSQHAHDHPDWNKYCARVKKIQVSDEDKVA